MITQTEKSGLQSIIRVKRSFVATSFSNSIGYGIRSVSCLQAAISDSCLESGFGSDIAEIRCRVMSSSAIFK